ncbi:extracellular solute-binding protein [Paenibacillus koleovorans]|uniref:extracellular solute-binding protein n=1 Tax=Paenibacillus koleovorans TaxID=121608 RepID=UPI000FD9CB1B|nr:extracellular solute-binding protein [Paenibacillus koleovorans]
MKKILVVAFVFLIAVSLVACSGTPAATEQPVAKEDLPPLEFTISMRDFNNPFVVGLPDINKEPNKVKLEELTNTKFDIRLIPNAQWVERMNVMFASGDIPDIVNAGSYLFGPELAGAIENDVFLPLNDLLKKHGPNLLKVVPKAAWDAVTYNGKIYAIPDYLNNPNRRAMNVRMDLVKKAGLGTPRTLDEYVQVLRAFKSMGVEQPFVMRANFKYSDTFFGAFDALPYQWEYYNGKVVPKFMAGNKGKEAVAFHRKLYEEGLIHKEFVTLTATDSTNAILAGKGGMWSMNGSDFIGREKEVKGNVPGAEVAIIPSPTGPDGKGGHFIYDPSIMAFYFNARTKVDVGRLIEFIDWQVTQEGKNFFTYGGDPAQYKAPANKKEEDEEGYRVGWLWMVKERDFNNPLAILREPSGPGLVKAFENILSKEGRDSIKFMLPLKALSANPDINPGVDTPPPIWMDGVARIIVGAAPIDYYDTIIQEWLKRGGQAAIDEATALYNSKSGQIYIPSGK